MDRVNIPGEAPGSATYYMGFAPEEYGTRLYEIVNIISNNRTEESTR